jgi:PPOX class probable F420-dependent enzyme
MAAIPPELRALITSGVHAHLTTINRDGSPQVSVTFLGIDGDEPYTYHRNWYQKLRNIERDNRVVLSFLAPAIDSPRHDYAVLHARARLDADADLTTLVPRLRTPYLGEAEATADRPTSGYLVRYEVERVGGVGPWAR